MAVLSSCMSVHRAHLWRQEVSEPLRLELHACEPPCGSRELNPGRLEEQPVLLSSPCLFQRWGSHCAAQLPSSQHSDPASRVAGVQLGAHRSLLSDIANQDVLRGDLNTLRLTLLPSRAMKAEYLVYSFRRIY